MNKSIEVAREKGYVETICGRKRMLPDIHSHNSVVRGYAERNAINAPIQGSAADIIKIAMIRIAKRLENEHLRSRMILQVHDELDFECPISEVERLTAMVRDVMEHVVDLRVPLIAEASTGITWADAK
jgi:DNA polymerase-1